MNLGLPGGAETETDSTIATPSKGRVGESQTPNRAVGVDAPGTVPVTCAV